MNAVIRGVGVALVLALALGATAEEKKVELPKKVADALKARFPKYTITKLTKEKEKGAVVYDIEFTVGGKKHEADIKEDGTIVNWEVEIALKDLPEAVKKAIDKKYPKATLKEAMKVTAVKGKKEELEGYEVTLVTAGKKKVEVNVSPEGKITEEESGEKKEEKKGDK